MTIQDKIDNCEKAIETLNHNLKNGDLRRKRDRFKMKVYYGMVQHLAYVQLSYELKATI